MKYEKIYMMYQLYQIIMGFKKHWRADILKKRAEVQKKIKDWNNSEQWKQFYLNLSKKVNESLEVQKNLKDIIPF